MSQPLAETIFWIAAVACVVAELAILRFTFATRAEKKSELVPSASHGGEILWAIVPALALVVLFGATWSRIETRRGHAMMDHSMMNDQMQMPPATGR